MAIRHRGQVLKKPTPTSTSSGRPIEISVRPRITEPVCIAFEGNIAFAAGCKLVTGSKNDVNFNDLARSDGFGIGLFDNAQVCHAYVEQPMALPFK